MNYPPRDGAAKLSSSPDEALSKFSRARLFCLEDGKG